MQWVPHDCLSAPISNAVYSCDSLLVYASFCDGSIAVFDAESLRPRCRISPSAYIPASVNGCNPYALAIAAHPSEPNQFALGTTDGCVYVIEPSESEGRWGTMPPPDAAISANPTLTSQGSEQAAR
eukprot:TRINITY_DN1613_c0_g1_i6.p1 TRINITY_DN1613_c0_g1~~TRINITY_DN1613_c0_g1_i6.p1  ORF type:complete len:126 (-),score=10.19 TRINITY_DN1613_c0_g1_i6:438-815(-)